MRRLWIGAAFVITAAVASALAPARPATSRPTAQPTNPGREWTAETAPGRRRLWPDRVYRELVAPCAGCGATRGEWCADDCPAIDVWDWR